MAEHPAVNRRVVGSSPTWGAKMDPYQGPFFVRNLSKKCRASERPCYIMRQSNWDLSLKCSALIRQSIFAYIYSSKSLFEFSCSFFFFSFSSSIRLSSFFSSFTLQAKKTTSIPSPEYRSNVQILAMWCIGLVPVSFPRICVYYICFLPINTDKKTA